MGIQSVHRALGILALFSAGRPRLGITEISELTGLSKTTAYNLTSTLADDGFLEQDTETRKYRLGLKVFELGATLAGSLRINQVGAGPLERLTGRIGLMSRLSVWDGEAVIVTLNVFPHSQAPRIPQLGPRVPAHCTAIGKAVLFALPEGLYKSWLHRRALEPYTAKTITDRNKLKKDLAESRNRGYAIDNEEYLQGIVCASAPVFDGTRLPVGSVSISGSPDTLLGDKHSEAARELMQAAMEISRLMGFLPEAISTKSTNPKK
jgi:IclR family KDG regulon transcriptional repressor